jgi:hypothetical protein
MENYLAEQEMLMGNYLTEQVLLNKKIILQSKRSISFII